jgi:hypothetical protein
MLAAWRSRLAPSADRTVDSGGIVLGWLTKLTVVLAVAGIFLFDAISVGTTKASLADQGSYAAREASEVWQQTGSIQRTYDAAVASATEQNALNRVLTKDFTVDADGTVHLTVDREAQTLVLYRWGRTRQWAKVRASAEGRSVAD